MQAELSIHCYLHKCDVEFDADHDACHPLDQTQLYCPQLADELRELYQRSAVVDLAARKALGRRWRAEHPEETRMFPAGYLKTDGWTFEQYPENYRSSLMEIDRQIEVASDRDLKSWVVRLAATKEVKHEHASN